MNTKYKPPNIKHLYFISLVPLEELRQRVKKLKEEMKQFYGASHALKSPAHITLQMPFRRKEEGEAVMIQMLKEFTATERTFEVQLSGFDSFEPRVLFLKVIDHKPIMELHDRLKISLQNELDFSPKEQPYEFHPHMTIATRDLTEDTFYEAWTKFEQKEFKASFIAKSIFLLKHNGEYWDIYREFPFGG